MWARCTRGRSARWIGAVLAPALLDCGGGASVAAWPDDRDLAEVHTLVERLADAVRHQDADQMMSVYVLEDPLVFSSHGWIIRSRDSLAAVYRQWDPARTRGTYVMFSDVDLRPAGSAAVVVTSRLRIARGTPAGPMADTVSGTWTGVFERRNGRWGLAHEHESFSTRPSRDSEGQLTTAGR